MQRLEEGMSSFDPQQEQGPGNLNLRQLHADLDTLQVRAPPSLHIGESRGLGRTGGLVRHRLSCSVGCWRLAAGLALL